MKRQILVYGGLLAVLALLLNGLNYYHFVYAFPLEIYIGLVALFFTVLGAWAGRRMTGRSERKEPFRPNHKARDYLGISDREMEVLRLVAEGCSNKQIADRLYISVHTVKTHVSSLLGKLDASRRTQAVRKAKSLEIIP